MLSCGGFSRRNGSLLLVFEEKNVRVQVPETRRGSLQKTLLKEFFFFYLIPVDPNHHLNMIPLYVTGYHSS